MGNQIGGITNCFQKRYKRGKKNKSWPVVAVVELNLFAGVCK